MNGGLVSPELYQQISETIVAVRGGRRVSTEGDLSGQQKTASRFADKAVILNASLPAATHALTGAASCLATVCRWNVSSEEYTETDLEIIVWNHSESKSYDDDTFGIARFIQGHWLFFGDCAGMAARGGA
jgi:hypothetical protein